MYCATTHNVDWATFNKYSTTEKAVGVWIDGRTVYQKTLSFGYIGIGETNKNHDISNLDHVIEAQMVGWLTNGHNTIFIPTLATTTNNSITAWVCYATYVKFFSTVEANNVYMTMRYVKTT